MWLRLDGAREPWQSARRAIMIAPGQAVGIVPQRRASFGPRGVATSGFPIASRARPPRRPSPGGPALGEFGSAVRIGPRRGPGLAVAQAIRDAPRSEPHVWRAIACSAPPLGGTHWDVEAIRKLTLGEEDRPHINPELPHTSRCGLGVARCFDMQAPARKQAQNAGSSARGPNGAIGKGTNLRCRLPTRGEVRRHHVAVGAALALAASDNVTRPCFQRGLALRQELRALVYPRHVGQAGGGDVVQQLVAHMRRGARAGQLRRAPPSTAFRAGDRPVGRAARHRPQTRADGEARGDARSNAKGDTRERP
jgi:hypothetical protein